MGDSKTSKRHQSRNMERQNRAMSLFLAGATYDQIAQQVGYSDRSNAAKAVTNIMRQYAERREEMATEARELQTQRLESLWRSHYPIAIGPVQEVTPDGKVIDRYDRKARSTEQCLRIWDRLNKIQHLDEPIRVEATLQAGPNDLLDEIAGLASVIREQAAKQAEELGIALPDTPVIDEFVIDVDVAEEDLTEPTDG
ncbi:terminase small subunit [Gordonia phage Lilbeanie]|uniref:Terminase small subunit n=1 Tax=Gordonia phage Lilbeanie TaxID=2794947 RepID=A0A7T1NXJ1_9CAUD|nr:Rnase E [Gordonia phage Lilbeanie]QPO17080.1 terminase small subunit [Gordonia phage Lilbeanie]